VREHTEQMRLPRFLWVPFELGRPFGAPNEPEFQRRVLRGALGLLERQDGPIVLEDFPEDAPAYVPSEDEEATWACPIAFHPPAEEHPELVSETLEELQRLAPWHELYVEKRGRSAFGASALALDEVARLLGELASGPDVPRTASDMPTQEWIRLGCDDLRTWYLEAAQGQPGRGSVTELRDWFWRDTAAARLIGAAATALITNSNPVLKFLGGRGLVPREYFPLLMPTSDPAEWETEGEGR
jgi:hypothetical protein